MPVSLTSRARNSRGQRSLCRPGPKTLTEEQLQALEAVRDLAPAAQQVLAELLWHGPPRVRLACVQEILDRAFGRSEKHGTMQVHHTSGQAVPQSADDQESMLVEALAALRARRAEEALVVDAEPSPDQLEPHPDSET